MVAISAGKSTNIHIKETFCLRNSKLQRCVDKQAAQLLKQLELSSSMLLVNVIDF